MSWRKALLVALRDYAENVRTKGFWFGIIVVPVLLAVSVAVPILFAKTKDVRRYAVLDHSGWLLSAVEDRAVGHDARVLLGLLRREAASGDHDRQGIPPAVRDLAVALEGLDEQQLDAVADAVGGRPPAPGDSVTAGLRARIDLARPELVRWLASLGPEEARAVGAGLSRARYQRVSIPQGLDAPEAWLQEQMAKEPKQGGIFGYFVIGQDPVASSMGCKYVSNNQTDPELRQWFVGLAREVVESRRFEREGVAPETARRILEPLRFEDKQLAGGTETVVKRADRWRQGAPMAFVYLLWMTVLMTASPLLTNTVEEKSNRLIEVLLSSVSPLELLAGKIVGTAATGLTIVGSWMAFLVGAVLVVPAAGGADVGEILAAVGNPVYILGFVVYYVLGYLFYASILVAMGSVCDSLKDAQNLLSPVTMMMVVPLLALIPVGQDPNGTLAKILSWIPPFTPYVMMNRSAGPPAWWEYAGTTLLLCLTLCGSFWAAAKIFRVGILMTGKPPKLGEILRWLRAPVGSAPGRRD